MGNGYFDHLVGRVYAAVISDVLDAAGYRDQALDTRITHHAGRDVLVGRAATMLAGEEVELHGDPYSFQIEAEVVSAALEKVDKEDLVREELAKGASLADARARHRVL